MPIIRYKGGELNVSHSEEEKLNQFQSITSFPEEDLSDVITLLQNHSWKLEQALSQYFDGNWKKNLNLNATMDNDPSLVSSSLPAINNLNNSFLPLDTYVAPYLPVIKRLPSNYKEKFQIIGLQPSYYTYNSSPFMFAIMLLPNLILKLGVNIFSIFWYILSFGSNKNPDYKKKVSNIPLNPSTDHINITDEITAVLCDESEELLLLTSKKTYNELWEYCEKEFEFLLLIFLGDLNSNDPDINSQRFLKYILSDRKTLDLFKRNVDKIKIYIGSVKNIETWSVAKQLNVKYTPECFLVGNVCNSRNNVDGTCQMSVLNKLKVTSLSKFQNSLKISMETYGPELILNRSRAEDLKVARQIKQMQDEAYDESLRQDQIKSEKRRLIEKQTELEHMEQQLKEDKLKIVWTLNNLNWLSTSLHLLKEEIYPETEKIATLQIRTFDGKRIVKKFCESTDLYSLYATIGSHLYLGYISTSPEGIIKKIYDKIKELRSNEKTLCFKDDAFLSDRLETFTIEELENVITKELSNWSNGTTNDTITPDFELISPFPRYRVPCDKNLRLKDIPQLWPNGNLLIETCEGDNDDEDYAK